MASKPPSFRRSPHLVGYWQRGDFILHNYASGVRLTASPQIAAVLDFFSEWRTLVQARAHFDGQLDDLSPFVSATLLERSDRPLPVGRALAEWRTWNPVAGLFHMATRDLHFHDAVATDARLRRKARHEPMPSSVKRLPGAPRVPLPRLHTDGELARVLLERRTWRRFSRRALPLGSLGEVLGWTSGVQRWATLRGQGEVPLKTSPSGGARHPLEVYVCARRVKGLDPGLYHYAADRHCLERIARHDRRVRVQRYLPTQFWYEGAAALVFFTAVFARYQWKYSEARAYRAVFIEAGHQCQTFCLAATRLGLAPFCSMALADSVIEADLKIDGVREAVIYAAGVGERPLDDGAPSKPVGAPPLKVRPNPWILPKGRAVTSRENQGNHEGTKATRRSRRKN